MKERKGCRKFNGTVVVIQTLLKPPAYVGMGKGTSLITTQFKMEEGVQQGAVESSWLFLLGTNPAFHGCNILMARHEGTLPAITNNN